MYTLGSYRMHAIDTWLPPAFLAGGLNYYLPLLGAKLVTALSDVAYTPVLHVIVARLLTVVGLGASTPVVIWRIGVRFVDPRVGVTAALVATLSPMALGLSRIHYPDHYLPFFAAALLYCAWALIRSPRALGWYVACGALVGVLVSVKYTGGLFALLLLAAHVLRAREQRSVRALFAPELALAGLVGLATFVVANPFVVIEYPSFLAALRFHREHYGAGHVGLEALNGYRFHAELLLLTSFGVLGALPWLLGLVRSLRSWERLLLLALPPLAYVLLLGSYKAAINRNVSGVLPMVFLTMGIGIAYLLERSARVPAVRVAIVALLLAEPLARTGWSLANDFQPDGRAAAARWLSANVPHGSAVGFSAACWGLPVNPKEFDLRLYAMPARLAPGECLDYYVMDSWFYEHYGPGNSVFAVPVYAEHVFLNTGGVSYVAIRRAQDAFLAGFTAVKTFDARGHYGPTVTVYRSNRPCAGTRH
ncbi:MAG: glycosyltransferase family 39 protein [Candidatus Rokubacteria bacterium]|nr:glycosyltransferase family 39 protein [Candidatus Rokubacteria bacterium]